MTLRFSRTRAAAERTARRPWVGTLGRYGFVAQGASFTVVAVLALALALGQGGRATDPQGAFVALAEHSWGTALLIVLCIGLVAYALWRFAQAIFDRGGEGARLRGRAKRAFQLGQGALSAGLAVAAVRILLGARPSSRRTARAAAADVLSWPGGEILVGVAGVALIVAAVGNAFWGVTGHFKGALRMNEMGRLEERLISRLGAAAYVSLAVVLGLVGWFLLAAARDHRSEETVTLGGALSKIADAPYGSWLLGLTALGLLAFGLFSFAQARYHRV